MTRLAATMLTVLALVAIPASAQAAAVLPLGKAKAIAAKKAEKVKNDLRSEGARRAAVPGCWRTGARSASCYFAVYGYDASQDFHWKCMLRVNIRARSASGTSRYAVSYGKAVCG